MQPYKESFEAFAKACSPLQNVNWPEIQRIMTDKDSYLDWKADFLTAWNKARAKIQSNAPDQMPIWCDHERNIWINMLTMQQMDQCHYGDEA